ncbi:hypothetical protein [Candidatus Magnetaquicoccus inordinatus]|uniref:hypothetical protein n=1 Tax=Candidatus Magnetaquicoccus inordinatus TaxID=2496818 RepID=UPI00102B076D|nr:hypothetical protein [Candidatus Magnetaquicoccus inordinatus]
MATSLPGGSSLPSSGKPAVAAKSQPSKPAADVPEEELPSIEEIVELEEELQEERREKNQKALEEIRKKKEEDELLGKTKKIQKVDLSQIRPSGSKQQRKGGLPEHIAALPKDHPIRLKWEKGFRQRSDGSWAKTAQPIDEDSGRSLAEWAKLVGISLGSILAVIAFLKGVDSYRDSLQKKRDEVVDVITKKGFALDDPEVRAVYVEASNSFWLPSIEKLLENIKRIPRKLLEPFAQNPEHGSYVDYIRRHGKPFDEREAIEWQTRMMRKPAE